MNTFYSTQVYSSTKDRTYAVCVSKPFLTKKDKVVFIDDFLANGHPAFGVKNLIEQAGAELLGMGFVIEKSFQKGRACLLEEDSLVESLVRIQ